MKRGEESTFIRKKQHVEKCDEPVVAERELLVMESEETVIAENQNLIEECVEELIAKDSEEPEETLIAENQHELLAEETEEQMELQESEMVVAIDKGQLDVMEAGSQTLPPEIFEPSLNEEVDSGLDNEQECETLGNSIAQVNHMDFKLISFNLYIFFILG